MLAAPVVLALGAAGAAADPLVVRGPNSVLVLDFEGDFFRLAGDGFAVNLTGPDNLSHFVVSPRPGCDPCTAGEIWDPGFRTDEETDLGSGNAQFGATSYPDVRLFGTLDFDATAVTFDPPSNEFFFMRSPFTFSGRIRGVADGRQAFVADLAGAGTAFRVFDRGQDGRWVGGENQFQYRFADPAPVPEPATLLLVGTGAAVAGAVRRRRRV